MNELLHFASDEVVRSIERGYYYHEKMIRKLGTLAFVAVCFLASAAADSPTYDAKIDEFQKSIYRVFWHMDQPEKVHTDIYNVGVSWSFKDNLEHFKDQDAVLKFIEIYNHGMLPRDHAYSVYHEEHMEQTRALYYIFYGAENLDIFFKSLAWARVYINKHMFYHAAFAAISHRTDTINIRLPNTFEVFPNLFWNMETMKKLAEIKMSLDPHNLTYENPIVFANYSDWQYSLTRDPETRLSYFREDVHLNQFYFLLAQEYPYWLKSVEGDKSASYRGEIFYHTNKYLVARYGLERLANGINPGMESLNLDQKIITGFIADLEWDNGVPFPSRQQWSHVPYYKWDLVQDLKAAEERVSGLVAYGKYPMLATTTSGEKSESLFTRKGFNMIANILEGNADSVNYRFFGSIAHFWRKILGFGFDFENGKKFVPSALEHDATCMRDPGFYRIISKFVKIMDKLQKYWEPYTKEELSGNGVGFESVAVDKMTTFWEPFYVNLTGGVYVHSLHDAESYAVRIGQYRLNYESFKYHFAMNAEEDMTAVIRIFMGQDRDIYGNKLSDEESRKTLFLIDYFTVQLKSGSNKVERKSSDGTFLNPEYISDTDYYKQILKNIESHTPLPKESKHYGFPRNLYLPKGRKDGFPIRFLFSVHKVDENESIQMNTRHTGPFLYDNKNMGFPADRPFTFDNYLQPNIVLKDTRIYHKGGEYSYL